MAINNLVLAFNDFKLNDVIDPEQFDTNNAQIVAKMNEVITQVNSPVDIGIEIGDGTITGNKLADGSIGETKLTQGVLDKLIAPNSVDEAELSQAVRDKLNTVAGLIVDADKIQGIDVVETIPNPIDDDQKALIYDGATNSYKLGTAVGAPGGATLEGAALHAKDFGAVGDGLADDTVKLQDMLTANKTRGGGVCHIPYGSYKITAPLKISSNTTLLMDGQCIIVRGSTQNNMLRNDSSGTIGVYGANENIHIVGGIFDVNGAIYSDNCTAIAFGHCTNISLSNTVFDDLPGSWHFLELNAVQDAYVNGCRFMNANQSSGSEMFQIDTALGASQFPWFGPYDDTNCNNITIENCVFEKGYQAFGSHTATKTNTFHYNVTLRNNKFINLTDEAVGILTTSNITIEDNFFKDCLYGVYFSSGLTPTDFKIVNNTFREFKNDVTARAISLSAQSRGVITGNFISNIGRYGIFIQDSSFVHVANNTVTLCGYAGLGIWNTVETAVSNNSFRGNATNASASVPYDVQIGDGANGTNTTSYCLFSNNHVDKLHVNGSTANVLILGNRIAVTSTSAGTNTELRYANNFVANVWTP